MKPVFILCILLLSFLPLFAQWHVDENFDSITTLPTGWTIHDDGDGNVWRNLNNTSHAHSTPRAAFCDNYMPNQNADWLITPQINVVAGDSLKFYTRSWISTENLQVFVSTTGTAASNFTMQLLNLQNIGTTYQLAQCSLNAFAGQSIYIGFYWECDNYGILVDDVKIGQPLVITPELNLPESFSFVQGESLDVNFTPYAIATELSSTTLTWSAPQHVAITANGLSVHFSSPDWAGTESITFTLHDNISGLTASDAVSVIVSPPPVVDLALTAVSAPHPTEYVNSSFTPQVTLLNNGQNLWDNEVSISLTLLDAQGTAINNWQTTIGQALQPEQSCEVSFPAISVPAAGSYGYSFYIEQEDGNMANNTLSGTFDVVLRINSFGPDGFGYRYLDSTAEGGPAFNWIDISSTGTSSVMYGVNLWGGDDNFSEPIPLGFNFPFYGTSYNTANVDINGEILLQTNNPWYDEFPDNGWDGDGNMFNYMYPIPGYTQMPALISVYWDDLFAEQGTGDVFFQTFGDAPNRYTVIQWHNVRFLAGTGATQLLDFEVVMYENGEMLMQYNHTATHQTGATIPHDNGRSATIGIQNQDATIGIAYLREIVQNNQYIGVEPAGNLLFDGLAIRFFNGPDTQAPIITYTPIGNTFDQSPGISARIVDLNDITEATLHYSIGGPWQSVTGIAMGDHTYLFSMPDLPLGSDVHYYFSSQDEFDNSGTLPITAPTEYYRFKVLPSANTEVLIAYSGLQDYQHTELPLYESRLQALNIAYDTFNYEEYDGYSFPSSYSTILTYASVGRHDNYSLHLATALMDFMNGGTTDNPRNVYLSSDGWANVQHGNSNSDTMVRLFRGYFRTHYLPTAGVNGGGTNGLAGPDVFNYTNGTILCLPTSPIGTEDVEYPVYANSPDCILADDSAPDWMEGVPYPEIGAQNAFLFEDGPVDGHAYLYHGGCATAVETPIYRAFYFSFDYSQLTNQTQSIEFMTDLMNWFEVMPSAVSDSEVPQAQNSLIGNYPNPFNPNTTISFSLAKSAKVELAIYNLKGQKVKTIVSGMQTAGLHHVPWNGTDEHNQVVGSGVYFIRMQAGKEVMTRKLTLLK